jgi:protein tyrosine phosphatase
MMGETESNHDGQGFADYLPNLTELLPGPGRSIQFSRHPIVDGSIPCTKLMVEILDRIDAAIERGGVVYVHCWGGRGRTGTVICCWLELLYVSLAITVRVFCPGLSVTVAFQLVLSPPKPVAVVAL